ncbi:MAG: hypothetical protein NZ899_14990 [Thermoguttaceae bacterium]|nr:hypothetical protein [Thermoguttaceae bacterium]MDW8078013.1 hypothetical protein [Thermoguttaceae bacterium]
MYEHTQYGYWHLVILAAGALMLATALSTPVSQRPEAYGLAAGGAILCVVALGFQRLTIRDEGETLSVRFGPLPLMGTRIRYSDIESVERGRTTVLDGWGIHWFPGRGVTVNIWGFDCVKLKTKKGRVIRLGTDDPDGLCAFLRTKLPVYAGCRQG